MPGTEQVVRKCVLLKWNRAAIWAQALQVPSAYRLSSYAPAYQRHTSQPSHPQGFFLSVFLCIPTIRLEGGVLLAVASKLVEPCSASPHLPLALLIVTKKFSEVAALILSVSGSKSLLIPCGVDNIQTSQPGLPRSDISLPSPFCLGPKAQQPNETTCLSVVCPYVWKGDLLAPSRSGCDASSSLPSSFLLSAQRLSASQLHVFSVSWHISAAILPQAHEPGLRLGVSAVPIADICRE